MSEDGPGHEERIVELERLLRDTRELAVVGLKAAISAIAGLEVTLRGIEARQTIGGSEQAYTAIQTAKEHVRRGQEVLRAALESPSDVG